MIVIKHCEQMYTQMHSWQSEHVVLVPTMGNLHEGHKQLIQRAQSLGTRVVVSIFVNPIQFNETSDYYLYPRTFDDDLKLLESLQVEAVFAPSETEMYPAGKPSRPVIPTPMVATDFCGRHRPGHFDGVCAVVARLFEIIPAQTAVFGEKDYQQCLVIQALVKTLSLAMNIVCVETLRESDGLAYSSRNQHLSEEQRLIAPWLYKILTQSRLDYSDNKRQEIQKKSKKMLENHGFKVEYLKLCDASNLAEINSDTQRIVILCAAWLGHTRLIDNVLFQNS